LTFNQDFAGIGGDVRYLKTETAGSIYHGFTPAWVLSLDMSAGYIAGWAGGPVRVNDRFYKGGNTFRGFATAGIGPRATTFTEALGAKLYAIGSLQLSVPNHLPEQYGIKTGLFMDFGTLGLLDKTATRTTSVIRDDLALRASAGVSVSWNSPLGP